MKANVLDGETLMDLNFQRDNIMMSYRLKNHILEFHHLGVINDREAESLTHPIDHHIEHLSLQMKKTEQGKKVMHHDGTDGTHSLASLAPSPPASNKPGNGMPGLSEERGNAPACQTAKPELLFEITNPSAQMSMARCALDGDDEYGLAKIPVLPDSAPALDTETCE